MPGEDGELMSPVLIFLLCLKFFCGGIVGGTLALILGFTMDWYLTVHHSESKWTLIIENSFLFMCTMGFLIGGLLICMI